MPAGCPNLGYENALADWSSSIRVSGGGGGYGASWGWVRWGRVRTGRRWEAYENWAGRVVAGSNAMRS